MKTAICVAAAVAVLAGAAAAQTTAAVRPEKNSGAIVEPTHESRVEGDTIEECWTIASLPFLGTDNTCGFNVNYDEECPYDAFSRDVVYCYSPPYDMCVSISLCDSYYDTKVYVYEDEHTPGSPYACDDDNFACVDPPVSYTSWLEEVEIFAGHTYYIVVDGYGGSCGDYVLAVDEIVCSGPCDVVCDGVPEGEPTCYDGYEDVYNGGCSSLTFSTIPAGADPYVVCGETGVYDYGGLTYRDTDWYLIYPCGGVPVTATVEAEVPVVLVFVDLREWCDNAVVYSYVYAAECEPTALTEYLPVGQFAVFVAPQEWSLHCECGSEYALTIEGYTEHCDPTPVKDTSWGRVKALYR